jgi:diguanylate cyclase (GGDEF)-like protein
MVDPLLHVWNRCAIVDILDREARRAQRHHDPLSVLMVGVEDLEAIKDRYGEPAGAAILKEVTRAIRSILRPYDAVGRYSPEKFLIVLPDSDHNAAAAVGERLRRKVEACSVPVGSDRVSCAVNAGVAWIARNAGSSSVDALVAAAEDALLLAKQGGCNGVDDERDRGQPSSLTSPRLDGYVLEATNDDSLGSSLVAAQLARLRAYVVDD